MIEPNMATMLSYIMTDAEVPKESLQSMLATAVNGSFNSISVDGDESTSDTAGLDQKWTQTKKTNCYGKVHTKTFLCCYRKCGNGGLT